MERGLSHLEEFAKNAPMIAQCLYLYERGVSNQNAIEFEETNKRNNGQNSLQQLTNADEMETAQKEEVEVIMEC